MKRYLPHILGLSTLMFSPHGVADWTVVGGSKGFKSSKLSDIASHKIGQFSFASGKNNKLYIAYTKIGVNTDHLTALQWDGCDWSILGQSDILGKPVYNVDIEVDQQDMPYIAFGNTSRIATVINWNGHDWGFIGDENGFSTAKAFHLALSINTENVPYVAYKDTDNGYKTTMRYWDTHNWEVVGLEGFSGVQISDICTVLNSHDVPYVIQSYRDNGNSKINVMRWDKEQEEWVFVGEDDISPSQINQFSCGMDKEDKPYVAYSDAYENDKLTVKYWDNIKWTTLGDAGFTDHRVNSTSIVFDHNNMPYIGYQNSDDEKAYVMYWNHQDSEWQSKNNDNAISDGQAENVQLAVDHDNRVYAAYRDLTANHQITVMSSEALTPQAPISPTNLAAISVNDEVRLTWQDNSHNEVGFKIWRNGELLTTTAFNKEQYVDTDLTCGTTYQYQVAAFNAGGESSKISKSTTTKDCPTDPKPLPPTDLCANAVSTPSITLNWSDQSVNETAFILWRDGLQVAEIAANQTSYTDTGLTCGMNYHYELKAINNAYVSDAIVIDVDAPDCATSQSDQSHDEQSNSHSDSLNDSQSSQGTAVNTQAPLSYYVLNVASPHSHIVSEPAGIDCNHGEGQCQATFKRGTKVDLDFAAPLAYGLEFAGWEGSLDCNDSKLVMNDVKSCLARVYGTKKPAIPAGELRFGQFSSNLSVGNSEETTAVVGFILDAVDKQLFAIAGQAMESHVDPNLSVFELEVTEENYLQDWLIDKNDNLNDSINSGMILDLDGGLYLTKLTSKTTGRATVHINPLNFASDAEIVNISTRGSTQGNGIFLRFTLHGEGSQAVMIMGEALDAGVNPVLSLSNVLTGQLLAQNISWLDSERYQEIQMYHATNNADDAGILMNLPAGEYAIHLHSAGLQGQAIIELQLTDW